MKHNFEEAFDTIELKDEARERIVSECINHKHVSNFRIRYANKIVAAAMIGALFLCSSTAYAAINLYQAYMESMTEEEKELRYDAIQNGKVEADSFSRKLTAEEQNRLDSLRILYQQGEQFPKNSMPIVNGESDAGALFYDYVAGVFYLPEETLTDDQLLQIIDVWEKANYTLTEKNSEMIEDGHELTDEELIASAVEFMEQYKSDVALSDEEKVLQFVDKMLSVNIFNGDDNNFSLEEYKCEVTLYGEPVQKYWVTVENDIEKYSIFFTPESTADNLTLDTYYRFSKENSQNTEKVSEETLYSAAKEIPEILNEYLGINTAIVKTEIFNETELVLTDEKGNRYKINLSAKNGVISHFLTYQAGKYDDINLSGEVIE